MANSPDFKNYLEPVERIARAAGQAILRIYQSNFTVTDKADGSPLTAADEAAHELILHELSRLTPEIPVLSEESASVEHTQRAGWKYFWLVDPLDGTKEFVSRNGEFTVNIALIERDTPVLGVVHVPARDVTYSACRGVGAYKRSDEAERAPIRVAARDPKRTIRVVASRSHTKRADAEFLARIGNHDVVSVGSSLKFCLVAEGAADVYPRLGPTMEWDTAAAQAVVEVAGGRVVGPDNRPLRYNKPSLRNSWFIASGAGEEDWTRFLPEPDGDE